LTAPGEKEMLRRRNWKKIKEDKEEEDKKKEDKKTITRDQR
jgi:hypothetical protein